jgi:sulfoxide reductase catalytic subunit YedY
MSAIRIPRPWEIPERLATPEKVFLDRRQVLSALGLTTLGMALPSWSCATTTDEAETRAMVAPAVGGKFADRFPAKRNPAYELGGRPLTPETSAAAYNNFYEFTLDKGLVWERAQGFPVDPWKLEIGGLVAKPLTLDLDGLFKTFELEERLYRFRCVERWAMQVPWTGFPLKKLLEKVEPQPAARYVRFVSVLDPEHMENQRKARYYPWPYFEALRLDEASNELAFLVVGSYGHPLPAQHGAPIRLAIPWKYGYKSPKSLVKIELTDEQPATFWNDLQPTEYGFFSNVNPGKPHPRWSQAEESDIGTGDRRPTELYNGYGEQVASLYQGDEH